METNLVESFDPRQSRSGFRSIAPNGFSQVRLDRFRQALQRHIGPGQNANLVALVHHKGRSHVEVLGTTKFNSLEPIRRESIFRLASTTKPLTAVAAMILVEECKIRLDDSVEQWLPELKNRKVLRTINGNLEDTVPAKRSITVRDLLTLRSGYGEVSLSVPDCPLAQGLIEANLSLMCFPFPGSNDDFMRRLIDLPLAFQPGESWLYHQSLEILGILISRVSGRSLGDFMKERIFDPLGMKDTHFHVPAAKLARVPTCYGTDFPGTNLVVLHEGSSGYISDPLAFESGAGGLASTVDDLSAFGQMMMNFGTFAGERILSRPTVELMITDHISAQQKVQSAFFPNFWEDHSWGLGVGLVTKRTDVSLAPGRFGWDGAFGTSLWVDPKERLVGVLMAQRRPDDLAFPKSVRDFWNATYQLIDD